MCEFISYNGTPLTMELYVGELTYTFWRYLNDRAEKRR